jgi:hypothetical protein
MHRMSSNDSTGNKPIIGPRRRRTQQFSGELYDLSITGS